MENHPQCFLERRERCPRKGESGHGLTCSLSSPRSCLGSPGSQGQCQEEQEEEAQSKGHGALPCASRAALAATAVLTLLNQCQHRCRRRCCRNSCGQGLTAWWLWCCASTRLWDLCELRACCDVRAGFCVNGSQELPSQG